MIFSVIVCATAQEDSSCRYLATLRTEDSTLVKITRLQCNSQQSDFSPVAMNKRLYFISGRNIRTGVEYKDLECRSEITSIFYASMRDSVRTGKVLPVPGNINSKYHEGPFCFSADQQIIYYTGNDKRTAKPTIIKGIYQDQKWISEGPLSFCGDSSVYCHPALSPDGSRLWFSSDMSGGKGGMDLYYTELKEGEWQKPLNAGPDINSPANEVFPFVNHNTLFFSSNRTGGSGGLDLYRVNLSDDSVNVMPLEYPFNSIADDFGLWADSSAQQGYFSSSRDPRRGDDIYHFATAPDFSDAKTLLPRMKFCYQFFEENTEKILDTITFEFEWNFGDGIRSRGLRARHCYAGPGKYNVELNIIQKVSGEIFTSQTSYELEIDTPPAIRVMVPDTVQAGRCIDLFCRPEGIRDFKMERVIWSFGDGKYNSGAGVSHIFSSTGEFDIEVFVLGRDLVTNKPLKYRTKRKIKIET